MKIKFLLVLFMHCSCLLFAQQEAHTSEGKKIILYENGLWSYEIAGAISDLEIPKTTSFQEVIRHTGYSFCYNEKHEQANWVAYHLTREKTISAFLRTNKFLSDSLVKTGTANNADYKNSGFDRGHLAPAADMGWSNITMKESFFFSNMSPQVPEFNRGIWKNLESLVRVWAVENESVYIVTGPILNDGLLGIGANHVSVPNYFYKVVLDYQEPDIKGIAFVLPNAGSKDSLHSFAISIDSVEVLTGIDFFPLLPKEQEKMIEASFKIEDWSWLSSNIKYGKSKSGTTNCKGVMPKGKLCDDQDVNIDGYCNKHREQKNDNNISSIQCHGITKADERCRNKVKIENGYCHLHKDQQQRKQ